MITQGCGHAAPVGEAMGNDPHEGGGFADPHSGQKILFRKHADNLAGSVNHGRPGKGVLRQELCGVVMVSLAVRDSVSRRMAWR